MSRESGHSAFSLGFCIFLSLSVLVASGAGCLWGRSAKDAAPFVDAEQAYTLIEPEEPASGFPTEESSEPASEPAAPGSPGSLEAGEAASGASAGAESAEAAPAAEADVTGPAHALALPEADAEPAAPAVPGREPAPGGIKVPGEPPPGPKPPVTAPMVDGKVPARAPSEVPAWAVGKEVLVYRIEFLGMTMGYARFTFGGKVSIRGREAYHLNVRAWTSNFLSVIYPINDTIDYYLDAKTLAPLRQEFTRQERKKDDVAVFDQEKGKIVYRYRESGEIRKQVDVPPDVHDPVSVAYYFRARDLGAEERPRHVYGGRKLYQISSRLLGKQKIEVSGRPVDTVVIQPVIMRDGRPDNKGDLRMWMTADARHVPVRLYAKFRKIREWTLYAELMPPREGG